MREHRLVSLDRTLRLAPGRPGSRLWIRSMLAFGRNLTRRQCPCLLRASARQSSLSAASGRPPAWPLLEGLPAAPSARSYLCAIAAVAVPTLSRLADSPERYRQATSYHREALDVTMPTPLPVATSIGWCLLILGPQWSEASPIFAWLGLVGPDRAHCGHRGLALLSQGRTQEIFPMGSSASSA